MSALVMNECNNASRDRQSGADRQSSRTTSRRMIWLPERLSGSWVELLSKSWTSRQTVRVLHGDMKTELTSRQSLHRLPKFLHDPSPTHLVAACMLFSIAMNVFYHIHKGDRYQLGILACGAVGALAVGWKLGEITQGVVTGLGPWFVMVSLVLSAVFHRVLRDYGEMT